MTTSAEHAGGRARLPDVVRVSGGAVVYRLYDIGYGISIDRAFELLATNAPARARPVRGEAQAIQIPNLPLTISLGTERVALDGRETPVEVTARVFDFGVVSVRIGIVAPEGDWNAFTSFGLDVAGVEGALGALAERHARQLAERIRPAVDRPQLAPVSEDYIVFRVSRLTMPDGRTPPLELLRELEFAPLLLGERRPLSADARRELLPHRFSYYADDLAILTWDNALVVDSAPGETDVEYVLEFANAQLLELRYYDALLNAELPRMFERVAAARTGLLRYVGRGYAAILGELQRLVADSTELVERVENSLKVTDDVYLARIYVTALDIFRGRAWRAGIDRKLGIIRETYLMLNSEAQAKRAEMLETTIVLLILVELVMGIMGRH